MLSAGSEGAAQTSKEKGKHGKEREREMVVIMGLMYNKLREGAFRETLLSSSRHTHTQRRTDTHITHETHTSTTLNSA